MKILVKEYALTFIVNTMIDNGYKVNVEWDSSNWEVGKEKEYTVIIRRPRE